MNSTAPYCQPEASAQVASLDNLWRPTGGSNVMWARLALLRLAPLHRALLRAGYLRIRRSTLEAAAVCALAASVRWWFGYRDPCPGPAGRSQRVGRPLTGPDWAPRGLGQ